jgi:hypothetical protein
MNGRQCSYMIRRSSGGRRERRISKRGGLKLVRGILEFGLDGVVGRIIWDGQS